MIRNLDRKQLPGAWRFYWNLYAGKRRPLAWAVVAAVVQSLVLLPVPLLAGRLLDNAMRGRNFNEVFVIGGAVLILHLLYAGISLLTRYLLLSADTHAMKHLRRALVDKFYNLSRDYFTQADYSRIHTTIVQDSERVAVMNGVLVDQFLPSLITAVALCLILIWLYVWFALVVLIVAPLMYVSLHFLARRVKREHRVFREAFEDYSRGANRLLQQMMLTRQSGAENYERARQYKEIDALRDATKRIGMLYRKHSSGHSAIIGAVGAIILIVGGGGVVSGYLTAGELFASYAGFVLLRAQVLAISQTFPQIVAGNESLMALWELLRIDEPLPYNGTQSLHFKGRVRLEGISFRYTDKLVLRDVNMILEAGAQVALIGESGAGKTTIASLILGLHRPEKGRILMDDLPLEDLDLPALRNQIGVVPQDPIILPATIAENISYGIAESCEEQIERAARLSGIHEFIARLPQAYETQVGERGMSLSGGQRQRIAIARALIHQPRFLILDEPTNHLDIESVLQFTKTLRELKPPPTALIISHNINVVRATEYTYLLHNGSVINAETTDEVLQRKSLLGVSTT